MSEREAFDGFVDKWRLRWPEWTIAEIFIAPTQRELALAWFALLQEFADATWSGDDPAPGLAKLAWWQEELRGWRKAAHRHPLGRVLQPVRAPWDALADALPDLRVRGDIEGDLAVLQARLERLGRAIAGVEAELFDDEAAVAASSAIAAFVAEHVAARGHAEAAEALRDALSRAGSRPRRLATAMLRGRLAEVVRGRPWAPVPRWRMLWRAWGAARD